MRATILVTGLLTALSLHSQDAVSVSGRAWLDTLTSPAFHGRGYVDDGDRIAADWIAKQFARFGLAPLKSDYFEPFQFNVNTFPDSVRVRIDGRSVQPGTGFIVDSESGSASGSFAIVHITPDDLITPERRRMAMGVMSGKAAMVHWPASRNPDSLRLFHQWERDLMHYGPVLKRTEKLTWSVAQEAQPFPLIEVKSDDLPDSASTVDLRISNKLLTRHQARNVLGMVKGKSKKWIIVGAHYDHLGEMGPDALFPGANDNASGVAMLLSLAEHFSKGKAPKHNLLFAAFAGEEAGLLGSQWCVTDRPIDWKEVSMLVNLDILGTGDDGIMVVNATAQQKAFDKLVAINGTKGYVKEVKARGPACNSDHCPFVQRGVPSIYIYTLGGVAYYHDVMDRAETLPLTEFADIHALLRDFIQSWK